MLRFFKRPPETTFLRFPSHGRKFYITPFDQIFKKMFHFNRGEEEYLVFKSCSLNPPLFMVGTSTKKSFSLGFCQGNFVIFSI